VAATVKAAGRDMDGIVGKKLNGEPQ